MLDKLIKKTGLNIDSMLKNGTIAVITMFGTSIFFGKNNIMLAFPIALTSIVLGRQNFQVKTFSKALRILCVDITIIFIAFLSSLNIFIGIPLNFISIFLIIYVITTPYDPTFYKPFIMLFVFTQYANITLSYLPLRIMTVVFGIVTVILCNMLINKVDEISILSKNIDLSLKLLIEQINNIISSNYDNENSSQCSKLMRDLAYKIYVTRYKHYLTTNLGKIQFNIFLNIEYLNIFLKKIHIGYINHEINKSDLIDLIAVLESSLLYSKGKVSQSTLIESINNLKKSQTSYYSNEIFEILLNLQNAFIELSSLDKRKINKLFADWERSDIDRFKKTFKEYFKPETIRFKFAMRMACTLTFAIFMAEILGFYKIIWAIITIMSIMQPYYEDTLSKTKERVIGNVIAIIFTGVLITFINVRFVTIAILVCSLYLLYGFKEYYKISLFAAIASICVASLTENIKILVFYRVVYVIAGVLIVMFANKYIFPYKLKNGIYHLIEKIIKYNNIIIKDILNHINNNNSIFNIRDMIIHSTLISQKLYLRNLQYNDDKVTNFIAINNNFVIEIGYKVLSFYKKNKEDQSKNIEDILSLYNEFNTQVELELSIAKLTP